ncbi:MAG: radical SAM protein [Polyangia bacterium]
MKGAAMARIPGGPCDLCPRRCGADRRAGEVGACGQGASMRLAAASIHRGEEPPISGSRGSATLFFSGCPLECVFCQNYPISQLGHGREVGPEELARKMIALEARGAHNVNLVTAGHFAPLAVESVERARADGLSLPVVWNSSGYESLETVDLLRGTVDIYLSDIKYGRDENARAFSGAPAYWSTATAAARAMLEQVGPLRLDRDGIATRGLIVRHLVLPGGASGLERVAAFVAGELGPDVPLSLMSQYFPAFRARDFPPLDRATTGAERREALETARDAGIRRGWSQDPELSGGA